MPSRIARQAFPFPSPRRAAQCLGLAFFALLSANSTLQNAIANGDTRTLTFRHTHREEEATLTVTFKRDGKYDEASAIWQEVLRRDSNFELAHTGLAKSYYKKGDYVQAMQEYVIARNKDGYSLAFGEWRHDFLRQNFGWVLPLIVFACWVVGSMIARTIRCASVGAPVRYAWAMASVVRPQTSRSVSATCASGASAG